MVGVGQLRRENWKDQSLRQQAGPGHGGAVPGEQGGHIEEGMFLKKSGTAYNSLVSWRTGLFNKMDKQARWENMFPNPAECR